MKTKLLSFAIRSLFRRGVKNIFILVVFTWLVFLLASVFQISASLQAELESTVNSLPAITVQRITAGKQDNIDPGRADVILEFPGVADVIPRVWGYYYFDFSGVNFSIVGIDPFANQYKKLLEKVSDSVDYDVFMKEPSMIVGPGVRKLMTEIGYRDIVYFPRPNGAYKSVKIAGVISCDTELESGDTILMSDTLARELLGLPEEKATDIVVKVSNPEEIPTIAAKIRNKFPDVRTVTRKDIRISYQNLFDYKSGIFLTLFLVSILTFLIIVYDKVSGLTSEEKTELGILKALGWKISDIMAVKFYETIIIALVAFLTAFPLSLFYVYILQAPLLKNIFLGYAVLRPEFRLPFVLDFSRITLLFFTTVPVYLAATIIPAWKASTLEPDEVLR